MTVKVYLLQHSYEYEIYEDIKTEETKIIGIYSTEENAKMAKAHLRLKKGFNRFPDDCFYIDEYELDKNHWIEGFVTWNAESSEWVDE